MTVEVFQESIGRRVIAERRVARFDGLVRSVAWRGRGGGARDGVLSARFTMRLGGGHTDTRRIALRRSHGRFTVLPPFHRPDRCALVRSFKLTRPVFGGRPARALEATYRLDRASTVTITIVRGGRVVRRYPSIAATPGPVHRLRISPRGLVPGTYEVRLAAGGTRQTLSARRL